MTKEKSYTRPEWTKPSVLNKMKHGDVIDTKEGFKIRRVAGGFIYEYEHSAVFISNDELRTD